MSNLSGKYSHSFAFNNYRAAGISPVMPDNRRIINNIYQIIFCSYKQPIYYEYFKIYKSIYLS